MNKIPNKLTMKKLLILLAAVIVFILNAACKKDVLTGVRPAFKPRGLALDTSYTTKSTPFNVVTSTKDTLSITKVTTTAVKVTYDTVIHKYVAPVNTTGIFTTKSTTNKQIYYSGASNLYIHDITIDLLNGSQVAIYLSSCKVVHIKHCIIKNTTNDGIQFTNCSNVLIDSCFFTNVRAGVNAKYSTTVKVVANQFLNMNGPYPSGNFVQFNNINGSANWIKNNRCEDIAGVAKHPQDGLSVYQSNGLQGDSIQVIGNWIRGGQYQNDSGGAAAIVLGDVGGSYQVARNNIVVNGGFVGMQVQGGSHIKMDHNLNYSSATPYSNDGMSFGNYSGHPVSDITMSYNKIRFYNKNNIENDMWYDPSAGLVPAGWNTNITRASIDATILPATIITWK